MQVGLLGPLEVTVDGARVQVGGPKERAVLAVLALRAGATVTASQLVADLWGDEPPRSAPKTLQTYISHLRRALPSGTIRTVGGGYRLEVEPDAIDARRFEVLVARGCAALTAGDAQDASATLDEALAGWRGEPLAEFESLPVAAAEAVRLSELRLTAVEVRVDAGLALGEGPRLVGELQRLVRAHSTRERLWGQLMIALYQSGRQADALKAYQQARHRLVEVAGVEPGAELRRLERAVLEHDGQLLGAPAAATTAATQTVTVLLTDIESSTALWEADHALMSAAVARHETMVTSAVAAHRGRIVKARGEGDSTFSVFGSATDAVACAVDLQRAISAEEWAMAAPLRIRAGIHTGEVQVRDGDYYGRAINRAARLRSLGSGGQVLLSAATASLVADDLAADVELVDLGEHVLRDIVRPEHVHGLRATGLTDPVLSPTAATAQRLPLPAVIAAQLGNRLVGRATELERLLQGSEHDLAAPARRLVLLAGEPGIGKTRLAAEAARRRHEAGATVVHGRCDEEPIAPYQPFTEIITALGTSGREPLPSDIRLLLSGTRRDERSPDVADGGRWRLFEAVSDFIERVARSAPLVLVLDDLHWADAPTLALLRHVLQRGDGAPVAVVATYRDTDVDRTRPLSHVLADLARLPALARVLLGPLDDASVDELARQHGLSPVDNAAGLGELAGGNPFFVIELARHVDESGDVDLGAVGAPQGVRDVVGRRLSRLPGNAADVLATAAVVGREFDIGVVTEATGSALDDVLAVARAGTMARLLEEDRAVAGRFAFAHALVRETLLDELGVTARVLAHRKIAEAIEGRPGGRPVIATELAHHYSEAAASGCADRALEWSRRAAEDARARFAHEEAAAHLTRGLEAAELLERPAAERVELWIARGRELHLAGAGSEARETLRSAADLARSSGDSVGLARSAIEFAEGWFGRVWDDDIALLDEALDALDPASEPVLHARVLAQLSRRLIFVDDERLARLAPDAVAEARAVNDPWALRHALHGLLLANVPKLSEDETEALLDEIETTSLELDAFSLCEARVARIMFLVEYRDCTAISAELDRLRTDAAEQRIPVMTFYVALVEATLAVLHGNQGAADAIDEAERLGTDALGPMASLLCGIQRVHLALSTGEVGSLIEYTETESVRWTQQHLPGFTILTAVLRSQAGDHVAAQAALVHFDGGGFAQLPRNIDTLAYWVWLADLVHAAGTPDQAERLAAVMEPFRGRCGSTAGATGCAGSVDHALGICALVRGDIDSAIGLFETAEAIHRDRLGSPWLTARSQLDRAAALILRDASGDRAAAEALASAALDCATQRGFAPLSRRARAVLADARRPAFPTPLVTRTPLLGRTTELAQARRWLEDRDARGLLLVSGEPGIGKTRFVSALAADRHAAGDVVLYGRCEEETFGSYQPIAEALRGWPVTHDAAALVRALPDHAGALSRVLPELSERVAARLADVAGPDADMDRVQLFDSVVVALEAAAGDSRLLLVVDDLHWANAATLALLRHLLRADSPARPRVIGTYRDTDLDRSRPFGTMLAELWREAPPVRIDLQGLERAAVAAMLDDVEAAVVDRVLVETGGNPLFVALLAHHLRDADLSAASRMPEGVREVIGQRLDALPSGADRVLVAAAVAGAEFDLDVVAQAAEVTEEAALSAVEAAVHAGLLAEVADRVDRFAFAHALVARVLRDGLVTSRRIRLHRGVARALAARADAHGRIAELAHHFGEAAAAGCLREAIDYARRAGEQAVAQLAYEQAAVQFASALELMDLGSEADERERAQLLLALGRVLHDCGEPVRARGALGDATTAARKAGDGETFAHAACELVAYSAALTPEPTEEDDLLAEAVEMVRGMPAMGAQVLAQRIAWRGLWMTPEMRIEAHDALRLARESGDRRAMAKALGVAAWLMADIGELEDELEAALADSSRADDLADQGLLLQLLVVVALAGVDGDRARHLTARHHAALTRSSSARTRFGISLLDTMWAILEGPPERAEELAEETLALGQRVDRNPWVPLASYATHLIPIRYLQGRAAELVPLIEPQVERTELVRVTAPGWWSALALGRAAAGDVAGAKVCIARVLEFGIDHLATRTDWGPMVFHLAEVCGAIGDADTAALFYERALPASGRMCTFSAYLCLGVYDHHLGLLAAAAGRPDDARRHLEAAVAQHERLVAVPWEARSREALARVLT